MDLIQKASDHLAMLERKIAELEKSLQEKDEIIKLLQQEIPGNDQKLKRLGIEQQNCIIGGEVTQLDENTVWTSSLVRETFVKYFTQRCGHTFWKSSPCVPVNDSTLLFANAGMNQFKQIFLGQVDPAEPDGQAQTSVQHSKVHRAGGKHNDLDDVGKDVYHHTFFEMLGNWSFGDYFKKEAIDWAFDLLTNVYKMDPSRIYVTYFGGDEEFGVALTRRPRTSGSKHLPANRVLPFDKHDNWWSAGDVGPCGPCSELHYDRIGNRDAASLVNMDDPNVVEIWNLVFMQYNRSANGKLEVLPNCHIDTGMGFERVVSTAPEQDLQLRHGRLRAHSRGDPLHVRRGRARVPGQDGQGGRGGQLYRQGLQSHRGPHPNTNLCHC